MFTKTKWLMQARRNMFLTSLFSRMTPKSSAFNGEMIDRLHLLAEQQPQNATAQSRLYEAWLHAQKPMQVIKRFEEGCRATDASVIQCYLDACQACGQGSRALNFVSKKMSTLSPSEINHPQHPLFTGGGTKDNPLYIQNVNGNGQWSPWRLWRDISLASFFAYLIWEYWRFAAKHRNPLELPPSSTSFGSGPFSLSVHKTHDASSDKKKASTGKGDPVNAVVTTTTFADVQGCEEAKAELAEIVDFLKNPGKYTRLGAKMPRGVLLVGPPGTGKTLLARAVAGEAKVPFLYATGSQFDEMFVGVGSARIHQMFVDAAAKAPCIVFIDEIDAVGSKRSTRDPQHTRQSLNQLLTEMDGFATTVANGHPVVVMAATNMAEALDRALVRPGRFDRHIHVPLPDVKGRQSILEGHMRGTHVAPGVDLKVLARGTPGFSGADLAKLVNQAKIAASVGGSSKVTQAHLERSRDDMLMGKERPTSVIEPEQRQRTAVHESGHAVVAMNTPYAMPIHKATIVPRSNGSLGSVSQLPESDLLMHSRAELLARLDVAMGGRVAEELTYGKEHVTSGASSDFAIATAIARAMVTKYGMGQHENLMSVSEEEFPELSSEMRHRIEEDMQSLLKASYERAKSVLLRNRSALHRLATALLEAETLSQEQIRQVLAGVQ